MSRKPTEWIRCAYNANGYPLWRTGNDRNARFLVTSNETLPTLPANLGYFTTGMALDELLADLAELESFKAKNGVNY